MRTRSVARELGLCRSARTRRAAGFAVGRHPRDGSVKMAAAGGGKKTAPLRYQEPIGGDAERAGISKDRSFHGVAR